MPSIDTLLHVLLVIAVIAGIVLIYRKKKPQTTFDEPMVAYPLPDVDSITPFEPERPEPVSNPPEEINSVAAEPELPPYAPPVLTAEELLEQLGAYDPRLDLASYRFPVLDLLDDVPFNQASAIAELEENKNRIVDTLALFGIAIDQIKATAGPVVNLYELTPRPGTRIAQIKKLERELSLSIGSSGTQVLGHLPGTGHIGIEVPNRHPEIVSLRSLIVAPQFQAADLELPIILGKSMRNETVIRDLACLPHLLVAGATGQGKSVGISALLLSLLYKKHPAELKLVLIDVRQLELSLYRNIARHFLAELPGEVNPVIGTASQASRTLEALCKEMDLRYDLLEAAQVRDLKGYHAKFINRELLPTDGHRYLPYIVLVIDELADLVTSDHPGNEASITRLAQLGRAAGIHLVISTQRPTVNLITGTIKANFTARIAFRLSSLADSRTVLEQGGAEQLKGHGDFLFSTGTETIRIQGAYVGTAEVERVCDFIGTQRGYAAAMPLPGPDAKFQEFDPDAIDPMFEEAARLIVLHQQGSTSLIQRKLKLGYNRAGRIIDQLEAAGIVGPFEGSKQRDVLIPDDYALEQHLRSIRKDHF